LIAEMVPAARDLATKDDVGVAVLAALLAVVFRA
jgi:hypothetical protein